MKSTETICTMRREAKRAMRESLLRRPTPQKILLFIGGLAFVVLLSGFQPPCFRVDWQLDGGHPVARDTEANWNNWTTRAEEWLTNREIQNTDPNWPGRQRMYEERVSGSLWWDEKAAQYFTTKLERTQFPSDCSKVHWIAHVDHISGLFSIVHVFLLPLMFSMVRGHTLLPVADSRHNPAFDGCGSDIRQKNLQCFFNVSNCNLEDDPARREIIFNSPTEENRTSWEELLMEEQEFFTPGGVTVVQTHKLPAWETKFCVGTSPFSSFEEAFNYHKLNLWDRMGQAGKVGVVKGNNNSTGRTRNGYSADAGNKRVDMVVTTLMSSWMLNRIPQNVIEIANKIMANYSDEFGRPRWRPPVLAVHVRQTDKANEDPYYQEHFRFRPVEDYASQMQTMEEEYGFQWPSIFIISDSGIALETLIASINGEASDSGNPASENENQKGNNKRFIMYDWIADRELQETYGDHANVPPELKYDMQAHFLPPST